MKIGSPKIIQNSEITKYEVEIESKSGSQTLWYELDEKFTNLITDLSDATLIGLLIPAMAAGEDIYIEGTISEKLYNNVKSTLQSILIKIIPSLKFIEIYPSKISDDYHPPASGVVTGFSGGIDSFCVLADHFYSEKSDQPKITHLLFNNVGSHSKAGEKLFRNRYDKLARTAKRIGLPFIAINSNLDSFYSSSLNFQQTHTLRNSSVALLLQGGIGRFLYASSYDDESSFIGPSHDIAFSDSIVLPLISTGTINALSAGGEYSRVKKTLRVAKLQDSYETLDVCVNAKYTGNYNNCSKCWKCMRTLATLEISGLLENYKESFDINMYKKKRTVYFSNLFGSDDPLLKEIVAHANKNKFYFPLASHVLHFLGIPAIKRGAKRLEKRLRVKLKSNSRSRQN